VEPGGGEEEAEEVDVEGVRVAGKETPLDEDGGEDGGRGGVAGVIDWLKRPVNAIITGGAILILGIVTTVLIRRRKKRKLEKDLEDDDKL